MLFLRLDWLSRGSGYLVENYLRRLDREYQTLLVYVVVEFQLEVGF
jgi:hypothetical protein